MKALRNVVLPVFLAALWISISEFVRNQFLFISYWEDHYAGLGLEFPAEPLNGAVWGIWSMMYAIFIFIIARKFSLVYTFLLSWFAGFVLMWLVVGNMGVLPMKLLVFAVPLSLLEAFLASWIIKKLSAR